jgi:hypothetical protein
MPGAFSPTLIRQIVGFLHVPAAKLSVQGGIMKSMFVALAGVAVLALTGCATSRTPLNSTKLDPATKATIDRRQIEPGFTPEMVFLALGKPTSPANSLVDSATNGTWIYENFVPADGGFIKPGFTRKLVFDAAKQRESVVTEKIEGGSGPESNLPALKVTYRNGRVVEIACIGPS